MCWVPTDSTMTWPDDPAEKDYRSLSLINAPAKKKRMCANRPAHSTTAFRLQMEEFIAVANGRAQPRAGGTEGLESLKLALAILESGRSAPGGAALLGVC